MPYAAIDHQSGAVEAFFARLKHENDVSGELVTVRGQEPGGSDQTHGVQVVAAGVHRPFVLGGVLEARSLSNRQRVHIAAHQHRTATTCLSAEHCGHRGQVRTGSFFQWQTV